MHAEVASTRSAGVALAAAGVALVLVSVIELSAGDARGDGDNPADSLRYLAEYGDRYAYSGFALVVGGVALVVAVLGLRRALGTLSLAFSASSVFAVLSAGFLAVAGVMRMQATGTVPHMQGLRQSWGEAAYLTVQIAGTQGLLSAGVMGLSAWLIALAIVLIRRRVVGPAPLALLPLTALMILCADLIVLPFFENPPDELYVVYIASLVFGVPLCCVGYGIFLLLPGTSRRLARSAAPSSPARN